MCYKVFLEERVQKQIFTCAADAGRKFQRRQHKQTLSKVNVTHCGNSEQEKGSNQPRENKEFKKSDTDQKNHTLQIMQQTNPD